MPHSDPTAHDDRLAAEVVRQLADAAPPPPSWEAIASDPRRTPATDPDPPWRHLAMVAALALVVAGALVLFAGSPDRATEPLDPPPPSRAVTVAAWLDDAEPVEVQVCAATANLRLARVAGTSPLDDDRDLAGVTDERVALTAVLAPVVVLRTALESGQLTDEAAASVAPVVDAWTAADGLVEDPDASLDDRRAAVAAVDSAVDAHLAVPLDGCPLDALALEVTAGPAPGVDPIELARCVSTLSLDRALADVTEQSGVVDIARVEAALSAVRVWENRPVNVSIELGEAVVAVREAAPADRAAAAAAARRALREPGPAGACPTWTDPTTVDPE